MIHKFGSLKLDTDDVAAVDELNGRVFLKGGQTLTLHEAAALAVSEAWAKRKGTVRDMTERVEEIHLAMEAEREQNGHG